MSHSHDHPHHEVTPVEGSWLDPEDDRPSSVERRKFLAGLGIAAGTVAAGTGQAAASSGTGRGHTGAAAASDW